MEGMKPEIRERLIPERNIWIATVRPDGRPHLTPVWFVLFGDMIVMCVSKRSVKAKNLLGNQAVSLALENGSSPMICEGRAVEISQPWPDEIVSGFKAKYDWDILTDQDYDLVIAVTPDKWLHWG